LGSDVADPTPDIAHSIGVAGAMAINSQQRAAAKALFEFISRNISLHFDLQKQVRSLLRAMCSEN
jgi:hypothetical protein